MEYTLKAAYKRDDAKKKKYEELKSFFVKDSEKAFSKSDRPNINIDDIKAPSRVWALFARAGEDSEWTCLQVAQSKNALDEVKTAIEYMSDTNSVTIPEERTNSAFYEEVCPKARGEEYRKILYKMIWENYSEFKFCFLDVDKYLGATQTDKDKDAGKIIEICKHHYAEAKLAYETLAVFWRKMNNGIDGLTIAYYVDNDTPKK